MRQRMPQMGEVQQDQQIHKRQAMDLQRTLNLIRRTIQEKLPFMRANDKSAKRLPAMLNM